MIVLGMWFPSLSQLIMEFHRGPFLALFCLLLKTVPKLCQTPCYIDDSKLDLKFKTNELRNAVSAVNSDLNKICRWCCHNSLLMNPDKTKCLVIGVPQLLRQLPDFTTTLSGKPISSTPVAKDLVVFLDQCLSYDEHIRKTVASCINKLIQINIIKHLLDEETLLLIINSFVFSRLFYGRGYLESLRRRWSRRTRTRVASAIFESWDKMAHLAINFRRRPCNF